MKKRKTRSDKGKTLIERVGKEKAKEIGDKISKNKVGKLRSQETKDKISKSLKGKTTWNKGIPMSERAKQHLRKINTGKKQSEETIEKRRKSLIGKNLGKTHTEETKQKLREYNLGKKQSKETKYKKSKSLKAFYKTEEGKKVAKNRGFNLKGENNPAYIDGRTYDLHDEARELFGKSNCEICNTIKNPSGYKLAMHCITGDHEYMEPNNWMTLCLSCHQTFHKKLQKDGIKLLKDGEYKNDI